MIYVIFSAVIFLIFNERKVLYNKKPFYESNTFFLLSLSYPYKTNWLSFAVNWIIPITSLGTIVDFSIAFTSFPPPSAMDIDFLIFVIAFLCSDVVFLLYVIKFYYYYISFLNKSIAEPVLQKKIFNNLTSAVHIAPLSSMILAIILSSSESVSTHKHQNMDFFIYVPVLIVEIVIWTFYIYYNTLYFSKRSDFFDVKDESDIAQKTKQGLLQLGYINNVQDELPIKKKTEVTRETETAPVKAVCISSDDTQNQFTVHKETSWERFRRLHPFFNFFIELFELIVVAITQKWFWIVVVPFIVFQIIFAKIGNFTLLSIISFAFCSILPLVLFIFGIYFLGDTIIKYLKSFFNKYSYDNSEKNKFNLSTFIISLLGILMSIAILAAMFIYERDKSNERRQEKEKNEYSSSYQSSNTSGGGETKFVPLKRCFSANGEDADYIIYVTEYGEKYHRGNCSYLESAYSMTLYSAVANGYTPCSRCDPPRLNSRYKEDFGVE